MKETGHFVIALIGVTITIVGLIAAFSNAFDRVARHQVVLEDHDKRINAIERDQTTNDKLTKLKESTDYLGWQVDALKQEIEKGKRR